MGLWSPTHVLGIVQTCFKSSEYMYHMCGMKILLKQHFVPVSQQVFQQVFQGTLWCTACTWWDITFICASCETPWHCPSQNTLQHVLASGVEWLPSGGHIQRITKQRSSLAAHGGIGTTHGDVYWTQESSQIHEEDRYKYMLWFTTPLPLGGYTLPLADPWALPMLGAALALLFWQMLWVAKNGQMNLDNQQCLYAHGLAALLEEHDEMEGRVSASARRTLSHQGKNGRGCWVKGDTGGEGGHHSLGSSMCQYHPYCKGNPTCERSSSARSQ